MGARIGPRLALAEGAVDEALRILDACDCLEAYCSHVQNAEDRLRMAKHARFPGGV